MALKDNIKIKSIQKGAETEFQNIMNDNELDIKAKRDKMSNILKKIILMKKLFLNI